MTTNTDDVGVNCPGCGIGITTGNAGGYGAFCEGCVESGAYEMQKIEWFGLYGESWGDDLVPEAYSHPAKYSRGLIRQIYRHMLVSGMIAPGDTVGDPFGGVASGALDAMRNGLHWVGCELEPRFVELGNQNIGMWNGRYRAFFPKWGTAVLHQGDSRYLSAVVGMGDGCISSPPYGQTHVADREASLLAASGNARAIPDGASSNGVRYGSAPGQLGSMPSGDFSAALSSPPYADTIENGDGPGARHDAAGHPGNPDKISSDASYGRSPGQLGAMDGAISSSPFENTTETKDVKFRENLSDRSKNWNGATRAAFDYGSTPGNVGNDTGASFWQAAREIVQQTYNVLKPGAYAAWVCGDFVRRGERVYFGRQWLELCESVGFEGHTWAIAWKTEYQGNQLDIFGGDVEKRVDRVSFFRRLANEKNPDNAILNEDVIIVRKPL